MAQIFQRFAAIQRAIADYDQRFPWRDNHLLLSEAAGLLHVDFYASPFESFFDDLLGVLCEHEIARQLKTLIFHAHDHGANGTLHWNFAKLVDSTAIFPNLTHLSIGQYDGIAHNHPIIGYTRLPYDESGTLGKWLTKAPNLKFLTAPSAPDATFFQRTPNRLEQLNIQAGYDTQGFILNFSQSNCFPKLWRFEYRDFDATYVENYRDQCTPPEHFQALFQSPAFDPLQRFVWHNPIFEMDELSKLKSLRPELSFKVARVSSEWVK